MTKATGKKFAFKSIKAINKKFLETFKYNGKSQIIKIDYPEFSALCPFSGLPDIGRIIIEYIPADRCIELKSLKYYFISFRNIGIYQEKATDIIFNDLMAILKPHYIKISVIYNIRGGMEVTTAMENGDRSVLKDQS
jgi:7-cyano-7-deazaguanine reductase